MDGKQIVGGMILLIAAYLLLKDGGNTNLVIGGFSSGVTNTIQALQGNSPTAGTTIRPTNQAINA